jgi:hypothetical protein
MAKMEWRYPFEADGLDYISKKARSINDIALLLGVPAPGLAGGIARERTLERREYWRNILRVAGQPLKELLTSIETAEPSRDPEAVVLPPKPITHGTIADNFARSNVLPRETLQNPSYPDRLTNPVFFDVGPGNIKIRTAISMLQNYNRMFPDSDPLALKRYNDRYDLLVRDLKDPDSDTTVKIAGLVAHEGQDFFSNAMTPRRWGALSDDQRAAALTKYYAVGRERMEDDFRNQGANAGTYMPDFNGDGSDMYLYDPGGTVPSNPQSLKNALSSGMRSDNDTGAQFAQGTNTSSRAAGSEAGLPSATAALPPQVVANANYLTANGFAITPRTMYVAHVIGPQRAVDLFRTGATGSPDVPSPDAAMGDQVRGWVRALRADELMPAAGGMIAPAAAGDPTGAANALASMSGR